MDHWGVVCSWQKEQHRDSNQGASFVYLRESEAQCWAGYRVVRDEVRKKIQILLHYLAAACNTS